MLIEAYDYCSVEVGTMFDSHDRIEVSIRVEDKARAECELTREGVEALRDHLSEVLAK